MGRKAVAILAFFTVLTQTIQGQNILGRDQEEVWRLMAPEFDEFIERFNFKKSIDGSAIEDTAYVYWKSPGGDLKVDRKTAVRLLIDRSLQDARPELTKKFIQQVCVTAPTRISFYDEDWYAQLNVDVEHKGSKHTMDVVFSLQYEGNDKGSKWVIRGIDAPFLESPRSKNDKDHIIVPSQNGVNFIGLDRAFQDKEYFAQYLPMGFEEDRLTLLYREMTQGKGMTVSPNGSLIRYHLLQIPGWAIVVSYVNRREDNRGWLITDLQQIGSEDKKLYRKELLYIQ
ncbi:MAG: hypothetical protein H6603_10225 [Flavobacteriales bacterium]|nr:hypothetical protein [Flavobacteriales bacterium]